MSNAIHIEGRAAHDVAGMVVTFDAQTAAEIESGTFTPAPLQMRTEWVERRSKPRPHTCVGFNEKFPWSK